MGFLGSLVGFPWFNPTYGSFLGCIVGFPYVNPTYKTVGWVERINRLRKTSQFSGKAKPNTQHLNQSESFCWVSLGVLLGFLTSTQPTLVSLGVLLGFVPQPNLQFRRLG
ncbi:MAG: hypothetical protein EWV82_17220 [Microcystis aeruginosa Ma_AC_P_19900807_S299]|nr:MAG: hypothetical protein EWV82_17220 [Microcystis aeruginosa Ma_AC_P_19900807_S299]